MNKRLLLKIVFVTAVLTFVVPRLFAQPAGQDNEEAPPIKIAIKNIRPFVFDEDDQKVGFSIDLWQALAAEAGIAYEFVEVETVSEQIDAVAQGDVDAAIAAISMTEAREEIIDFSYPYFDAGLQIMTRSSAFLPLSSLITVLFSREVLAASVGLIIIIILFGHLVWLFERRNNPHFQHGYFRGVWEGIWWSAVTVTTVGYGDRTPRAVLGRLLALFWMFAGLFILANFTATITTQLTLNELNTKITDISDLRDKRIATVSNSTSAEFLRENGFSFQGVETIEDAYKLLENRTSDVIVYDAPVLLYYLAHEDRSNDFEVVGSLLNKELYGIALPHDSPYEDDINQALLALLENGTYEAIYDEWFSIE
ncbi:MAG: transporter substrate-binding domain-containing protein [Anaerolineae bacterium]|nr:transporter substrate-binding domain-containing protein [Anaerolineae bacterium]